MGVLRALPLRESLATPQRAEHPSAIVSLMAERLIPAGKSQRVLDLGTALGANIDLYSQFARKIHIEDLFASLHEKVGDERGECKLISEHLPYGDEIRFDLILCWDLLNYLRPEEIRALSTHLSRFSRPGTYLSTIVSVHKDMPATPTHFRASGDSKLSYEITSHEKIPAPRYSKVELQKFLGDFKRIRSLLLRNGYEEQIYLCER